MRLSRDGDNGRVSHDSARPDPLQLYVSDGSGEPAPTIDLDAPGPLLRPAKMAAEHLVAGSRPPSPVILGIGAVVLLAVGFIIGRASAPTGAPVAVGAPAALSPTRADPQMPDISHDPTDPPEYRQVDALLVRPADTPWMEMTVMPFRDERLVAPAPQLMPGKYKVEFACAGAAYLHVTVDLGGTPQRFDLTCTEEPRDGLQIMVVDVGGPTHIATYPGYGPIVETSGEIDVSGTGRGAFGWFLDPI